MPIKDQKGHIKGWGEGTGGREKDEVSMDYYAKLILLLIARNCVTGIISVRPSLTRVYKIGQEKVLAL